MTDIGGFVHSGSGNSRHLLLSVFPDTLPSMFLLPEVRISSEKRSATCQPHHKAAHINWGQVTKLN
ncbi:hypothetical protein DZA29_24465 [Citrobacter gillenii]|nr:hypothetical protein DZA29_24465 [Citrobacter gillenii]